MIKNKNFHKRLNSKTLSEIIQFRYSINGNTLLKDVIKLKSGELLIWCNTKKSKKTIKYDNGFSKFDNLKLSQNEWINECYQIFDEAIKINLRSDVPVGIFLSSGIDSAGILHFAKKNGYVETIFKRKRFLNNINSGNATMRGFDERNAINAPI